jgi:hypothetical protein
MDVYSKSVLTIIAALLAVLVIEPLFPARPVAITGAVRVTAFPADPQRVELTSAEPFKVRLCDGAQCANLSPITRTIGGVTMTDWALLTASQKDIAFPPQPEKVQICDAIGSCALLLPIGRASALAVTPLTR